MNDPLPQSRSRYRLYIDESGDHTYNLLDDVSHRYLALLGVWFRQLEDYSPFADELESFKRDIFGPRPDKPVVLHRTEIISRRGAFGRLSDPSTAARFAGGLLSVMERAKFKMVVVIIDKQVHAATYTSPFHPYHYCLAAMLDRYTGWLNYRNAVGDVMAEGRGREEDLQLKEAYRRVYDSGTLMFNRAHYQKALTSKEIKIQPRRANIAGLQLADLLAHPTRQQCLVERGLVAEKPNSFGRCVYEVARLKFNINERTGQVQGYGQVWLPSAP